MAKISLIIPGEPIAKGRPRVTKSGYAYTPAKTQGYENLVKMCYMEQAAGQKLEGALYCEIRAYFAIPKSAGKKKQADMEAGFIRPTKRPDRDNIEKAICDALNGLAYADDSCIVDGPTRKYYSFTPRVEVELWAMDG